MNNLTLPLGLQPKQLPKKKVEDKSSKAFNFYKATPSPENLAKVIDAEKETIDKAVASFAGGYASPIVTRRARLLAADAIQSYDPTKGAKLSTHLYNQLQAVRRLAPSIVEPVVVPEGVILDKNKLDNTEKELFDVLGREASDAEIADYSGLTLRRIGKIRKAHMPVNEGSIRDPEEPDINVMPGVRGKSEVDNMLDYVYYDLSPSDQKIFEWRTGYNGRPVKSNDEIALITNKDPKWVSQRASIIQKKINEAIGRV